MAPHRPTLLVRRQIKELKDSIEKQAAAPKGTLEQAYEQLETWDMQYLSFDRQTLLLCFVRMLENLEVEKRLGIPKRNLLDFLDGVG